MYGKNRLEKHNTHNITSCQPQPRRGQWKRPFKLQLHKNKKNERDKPLNGSKGWHYLEPVVSAAAPAATPAAGGEERSEGEDGMRRSTFTATIEQIYPPLTQTKRWKETEVQAVASMQSSLSRGRKSSGWYRLSVRQEWRSRKYPMPQNEGVQIDDYEVDNRHVLHSISSHSLSSVLFFFVGIDPSITKYRTTVMQ